MHKYSTLGRKFTLHFYRSGRAIAGETNRSLASFNYWYRIKLVNIKWIRCYETIIAIHVDFYNVNTHRVENFLAVSAPVRRFEMN